MRFLAEEFATYFSSSSVIELRFRMSARIYVGNLPLDIRESELDDLFYKYGRIREIELKTPGRPPAFAFITFDDHRDAEDAVRGRDGYNFDGYRIRVEFAKGDRRGGSYC